MEVILDAEATGLLTHESLNYNVLPYKLKNTFKVHCIVVKELKGMIYKFTPANLGDFPSLCKKFTKIIGHNIIDYDLLVLELHFGIKFDVDPFTLDGRSIQICDTLVLSKLLNPDRLGGHGLEAWGNRLSFYKGDFGKLNDWSTFSQAMLDYCEQDVNLNHKVYDHLIIQEWRNWDWEAAFELEQICRHYITIQSHFGFVFDRDLARSCVTDLNEKMATIEAQIEPLLPPKLLNKTKMKEFTPPKIQIKKSGELSSHMGNFIEKHGMALDKDDYGDLSVSYQGNTWVLPMAAEPIKQAEPTRLADQDSIKQYLLKQGWEPTEWKEKDLTVNTKKQKLTDEKYVKAVERYLDQTMNSEYTDFRLKHLKVRPEQLKKKLMLHDRKKPLRVLSSPSLTIGTEKKLCLDLVALGKKFDWVGNLVLWLTYRHRRNSIESPKGTGWLNDQRTLVDGRIGTPADTLGTNTFRYTHKGVANVPRSTSLYGEFMRALFGVSGGNYQIGSDSAGLEARVEGHFTQQFEGGVEYAAALTAEKPNDLHTVNAVKMGVPRDTSKAVKYATTYGAQVKKIAKMLGISQAEAEAIFEAFWEASLPLKILKERVVGYWKTKGRSVFILGIDGRKLMTRSEHSLLNVLFQSTGAVVMKRQMVMYMRKLKDRGLYSNPFRDSSIKATQMMHYHK